FKNVAGYRKELRAQILLPPHAVVTGCELWVDNVRHKAVIGTRERTRQAYTVAANNGERPLMVSTAGPGRVLLQPSTGYWGKNAKLIVEVTAPLTVLSFEEAALPLPTFAERNFNVAAVHSVSLASSEPLEKGTRLGSADGSSGVGQVRCELTN